MNTVKVTSTENDVNFIYPLNQVNVLKVNLLRHWYFLDRRYLLEKYEVVQ